VGVVVAHVDVTGTFCIRRARDRPDERRMLEQRRDDEILARLEVDADPDDQPRVRLEPLLVCHAHNLPAVRARLALANAAIHEA
jgi:hypothetical protein